MEDRFKSTKKAGFLGIMGNIFLLVLKATAGFMSNSQAMIADAFNSAGDIFASLMTFIGNKISSEPSDKDHNLGHGKAEYIFSLFISIAMIIASIKILVDSFSSLFFENTFQFSWFLLVVCFVTIIVKSYLYIYVHKLSKKYKNILLEANYKDHRNDILVTTCTLISILFSLLHVYWLDSIVGIGISIWICYTGAKIFIESYNVLMDISIDEISKEKIFEIAKIYKDIHSIEDFTSSPVGDKYYVSLTILVDGNMSTFESHKLADTLEKNLLRLYEISKVVVHVNPK